jgi:uncharacterized Fe-S cluster-containing radical SAM superfamily protein
MDEYDQDELDEPTEAQNGTDPKIDPKLRQKLEGLIPDMVRKTFYAGLGAVFTTEEGIRKLANDIALPKEVANFLISQTKNTKDDLFRIVAAELRAFLENLNLNEELQRLLTSLSFEIKTEIRFIPNDQKLVKPQIKNKVSVKRSPEESEEAAPPVDPDAAAGLVDLGEDDGEDESELDED